MLAEQDGRERRNRKRKLSADAAFKEPVKRLVKNSPAAKGGGEQGQSIAKRCLVGRPRRIAEQPDQ